MKIQAKCRYCGTKVQNFGDVCRDCTGDATTEEIEASNESLATLKRLGERQS